MCPHDTDALATLHLRGAERLSEVLQACATHAISCVTLLIAPLEADYPQEMLRAFLRTQRAILQTLQVRLVLPAQVLQADAELLATLHEVQADTAAHSAITLAVMPRADGRAAILQAVEAWRSATPSVPMPLLTEDAVSRHMPLGQIADPDLLIRTGCSAGRSLSLENTMLWQAVYTELYFSATPWQEFSPACFEDALAWYGRRERRFGGVNA